MSKNIVKFRKARESDAYILERHLRPEDRVEVEACGKSALDQILEGIRETQACWTGFINGEMLCVHGVRAVQHEGETLGIPWFLATKLMETNQATLLRYGPRYIHAYKKFVGGAPMYNMVHSDNSKSMRWLSWLGFTIQRDKTIDINGHDFHPFFMEAA